MSEGDLLEESGALTPGESSRRFINSVKSAPFKGHDSIRSQPPIPSPTLGSLPQPKSPLISPEAGSGAVPEALTRSHNLQKKSLRPEEIKWLTPNQSSYLEW